jgi:hypothetical protein
MYKALDIWLPSYLSRSKRLVPPGGRTEIMLCVCDHFEPFHAADRGEALARIALWKREFPRSTGGFVDSDGCPPRHTFFYPIEQYDRDVVGGLTELCQQCRSEVEIHLHHERDSESGLAQKLEKGVNDLSSHGLLSTDATGRHRFGFIHGDWALDDSHPEGRYCGVRNELEVLGRAGCFADFTMPSAPSPTQTRIINSLYYVKDTPKAKSHDSGTPVQVRTASAGGCSDADLLLIQGPLGLNWERRKFGILPRIENGDLTCANPPQPDRMRVWVRLGIHVRGRPEWVFIKLHTHGALPANTSALLGKPMRQFHEHLMECYRDTPGFRLHYVTARELVNILHAAEDGHEGNPGQYRDYRYRLVAPSN